MPAADLGTQASGRPLTAEERGLATALEAIYSDGVTEPSVVAERLSAAGVPRPSGAGTSWTEDALAAELAGVNASLDGAYAEHGRGA